MNRKRPHSKVKSGCIQCKARKIKCDERKPQCSNCERYSKQCTYRDLLAVSKCSSVSPVSPSAPPKDLSEETADLKILDLELLHHWTLYACSGFGDKPDDTEGWRIEVPRIACKHPFVMRGLLAISALHMARNRPDREQELLFIAAHYQHLALPTYRSVVGDFANKMTEENCHAVIAFAHLTSAHAFASQPSGHFLFTDEDSSTTIPEWLSLLRGARRILALRPRWIARGPMAYQLRSAVAPVDTSLNPEDHHFAALDVLLDQYGQQCLEERELETYWTALKLLRQSFAFSHQPYSQLGVKLSAFWWVEKVPQAYIEFLSQLRPGALILLSYFCVLLKRGASSHWYMEGVGERTIAAIEGHLDNSLKHLIAWPLHVVNAKA